MKNNKKLLVIPISTIFLICFFACSTDTSIIGNGSIISEERTAKEFNSIVLKGAGNVNVYPAEQYKVVVTTDSNIQDIITINVNNNSLYIDEKYHESIKPTKLIINVYLPAIGSFILNGAGNVHIGNGSNETLDLYLNGAGNINADNYQVKTGNVILNGVGNIRIWATENLSGNLSGVGNIIYKGNPTRNITMGGIGKVNPM